MKDLGVALGLVLVIEGLLWAAFPGGARKLLELMAASEEHQTRIAGAVAIALGVTVVWLFKV